MAFSFWKKSDDTSKPAASAAGSGGVGSGGKGPFGGGVGVGGGSAAGGAGGGFEFSPDKAAKFFDRAQTLHEATNYGYAMQMWLGGLRQEPTAMRGIEGFFKTSAMFFSEDAKGIKSEAYRDAAKTYSGRTPLEKYLAGLLEWSAHPVDPAYAVKAMQHAADLGLPAPSLWIAERAVGAAVRDKKPRKEHLLAAMEVYRKFDKMDKAVEAGEAAVRIDPTDAKLQAEVRNMSAESTMHKGGFDQTDQEGGFRSNIRDAAKQKLLEERDRVVTTEEMLDRQVAANRADYESNRNDRPNAIKHIEGLKKRGKPDDEDEILVIADEWFKKTSEFRFREYADEIRVRQMRRKMSRTKAMAEQPGASDEAKDAFREARKEFFRAQVLSLRAQVEAYPTDLKRRFEYGKMLYEIGKYEDAIGQFQQAKTDLSNKAHTYRYLGLAFQAIGYNDEAIETIRQAMTMQNAGDEATELSLKFALAKALQARAVDTSQVADADEAYKLAQQIAVQDFNYKDGELRVLRDQLKALIAKLRPPQSSPGA